MELAIICIGIAIIFILICLTGRIKLALIVLATLSFLTVAGIVLLIMAVLLLSPDEKYINHAKDFVAIQAEIDNIDNYEKAVKLIANNWERISNNSKVKREPRFQYLPSFTDSIFAIQKDSLNLRFLANRYNIEIEKGDTMIVFEAAEMDNKSVPRSLWASTAFQHSIFYTNRPIEVNDPKKVDSTRYSELHFPMSKTYKIKKNFYYRIFAYMEYSP